MGNLSELDLGKHVPLPFDEELWVYTAGDYGVKFFPNWVEWINFIGYSLQIMHSVGNTELEPIMAYEDRDIEEFDLRVSSIKIPDITDSQGENNGILFSYIRQLFVAGNTQLANLFKVFIADMIKSILWKTQYQLDFDQIGFDGELSFEGELEFGLSPIVNRINKEIHEKVWSITKWGYSSTVENLQNEFDIVVHNEPTLISEHEMEEFFKFRNLLVHNSGEPSTPFLKSVHKYDNQRYFNEECEMIADFSYLFSLCQKIAELVVNISVQADRLYPF